MTPDHVEAALNYVDPAGERPIVYMYEPPSGTPARVGTYGPRAVAIRNGRPLLDRLSLEREGFVLRRHASAVADFYDEEAVRATYYGETERLVTEMTGADRALMFDHTIRSAAPDRRGNIAREPVRVAHNDYTLRSGPQRVRDVLPAAEAEALLSRRFAVINVWRPIRGPVRDTPLALCDARSIASQDLVATEMRYRDRTGETFSLAFNPAQRWYYFPEMRPDEALIFKCFDSAADGRPRFCAHTAFDDPTTPPGAAARESIEARVLLCF